jgi:hypothetical protein
MTPEPRPPVAPRLAAWWVVALVMVVAIVLAAQDHLLRAGTVLSGACFTGAVLRLVLPERFAGGLVVRHRIIDAVTYAALGGLVLGSTLVLDLSPQ